MLCGQVEEQNRTIDVFASRRLSARDGLSRRGNSDAGVLE